jgi:hypothetical protein
MLKAARSRKKRVPTLGKLKKQAWALLSQIVRRNDSHGDETGMCYTCGAMDLWKRLQAGHAIPGRTGSVLFDEDIIRPQCYRCNVALRGNYPVFTTKLIRERAEEMKLVDAKTALELSMAWWERKLLESRQVRKWSRRELEELIQSYKARLN